MKIDGMYCTIEEARNEILKRREDIELKKKIEKFWGGELPAFFQGDPKALYFRVVLTGNFETKYFLDLIDTIKFEPAFLELSSDKFCTYNKDKVHLGKLVFFHKKQNFKNNIIKKKNIIDFHKSEMKPFKDMETITGEGFIDFHYRLFKKCVKKEFTTFDASSLKKEGESAINVYEKILSLCIINGILFENLIIKENEHEKEFIEKVIIPAYNKVEKLFNLKPLIVPLLPLKSEEEEFWIWYPGELESEVNGLV